MISSKIPDEQLQAFLELMEAISEENPKGDAAMANIFYATIIKELQQHRAAARERRDGITLNEIAELRDECSAALEDKPHLNSKVICALGRLFVHELEKHERRWRKIESEGWPPTDMIVMWSDGTPDNGLMTGDFATHWRPAETDLPPSK